MKHPQLPEGEHITIEAIYHHSFLPDVFPNVPKTVFYRGKVVSSANYDEKESVRLFTGDKQVMIRVIRFSSIVKVDGEPFIYKEQPKVEVPKKQVHEVKGSKGDTYRVTVFPDGKATCTCAGYGFRRTCSHIDKVLEKARV